MVLWCFVLNPHRRSPYSNFLLELRDKLRVRSPATYEADRVLSLSHFSFFRGAAKRPPFPIAEVLIAAAALLLPPSPLRPPLSSQPLWSEAVQDCRSQASL